MMAVAATSRQALMFGKPVLRQEPEESDKPLFTPHEFPAGSYQEFAQRSLDGGIWNWIDLGAGVLTGGYGPVL